ncbi:DUF421 domain-containing protein [Metabacillus iocasae]|uniref:Uncharacterized membrane protein YcaP (DUF421 family) n=1 Tax=Priestia iocasae TaxID=2291674 RepID=A0ABS2QQZ9_9BACI|nr:DUF421 domain-containing protein [Metabacillus iocasae]MBM7701397.1 uncharacterized membrane protein YcaP (DUF421 family) [Metabacillus iocasae]
MDLLIMVLRTVFLYIVIVLIFRVMGKREIGELSVLDLVVFIMIAEMAVMAIEDTNDPLIHTVIPMVTLLIIQVSLAFWSLKSNRVRNLIDGEPSIIIENGKIKEKEMRKQRYNINDLLVQLREKNVKNIADVEFAILETSGKLSVFEKSEYSTQSQNEKESLNLPFVIDGIVQEEHLKKENKTKSWLSHELRKLGYKEIGQISYCSYSDGQLYVDLYDKE